MHFDGAIGLLVARVGIGGATVGRELRFVGRAEFAEKQIVVAHERGPFSVRRIVPVRGVGAAGIAVARPDGQGRRAAARQ